MKGESFCRRPGFCKNLLMEKNILSFNKCPQVVKFEALQLCFIPKLLNSCQFSSKTLNMRVCRKCISISYTTAITRNKPKKYKEKNAFRFEIPQGSTCVFCLLSYGM
jgi:hypothetical protein